MNNINKILRDSGWSKEGVVLLTDIWGNDKVFLKSGVQVS